MKNFFILLTMLFVSQHLMSQKVWIEGYDIWDSKRIEFKGDSVTAFYQPKVVYAAKLNSMTPYRGLPETLPALPDGKYLLFRIDVEKKDTSLFHEWFMKNGVRDSLWIVYYENGFPLKSAVYKNNLPNGVKTEFNENGEVISECTLVDGVPDGYARFNQMPMYILEGYYKNGEKSGPWKRTLDSLNYNIEYYDTARFYMIQEHYCRDTLQSVSFYKKNKVIEKINGRKVRTYRIDKKDEYQKSE